MKTMRIFVAGRSLLRAFNIIQEDLPAFFLWRIQQHYGISDRIEFTPMSTDRIYGTDIVVKG